MPVRFMLDTDNLNDLTPHAELLATYADLVDDLATLQAKFPESVIILIDRGLGSPTGRESVFDVEPGALTPEQAAAAYDRQHARGIKHLTVYCDRNTLPTIDQVMGARVFYRWIATLDGTVHIDGFTPLEGPAAVQCLTASMLGIHADGSLVLQDHWNQTFGVSAAKVLKADILDATNALITVHDDLRRMAVAIGG